MDQVKGLKIAVQCARLLADTREIRFYPSKFVLITDVLDHFWKLLAVRLQEKAGWIRTQSGGPPSRQLHGRDGPGNVILN